MLALTFQPFVIISACKEDYDCDTSLLMTNLLRGRVQTLGYTERVVYGKYQGCTETSLLVSGMDEDDAAMLCNEFEQDCYLSVDQFRNAKLIGGDVKELGRFEASEAGDDYTIIDGVRYCCV